jgi:hypothetical protein
VDLISRGHDLKQVFGFRRQGHRLNNVAAAAVRLHEAQADADARPARQQALFEQKRPLFLIQVFHKLDDTNREVKALLQKQLHSDTPIGCAPAFSVKKSRTSDNDIDVRNEKNFFGLRRPDVRKSKGFDGRQGR